MSTFLTAAYRRVVGTPNQGPEMQATQTQRHASKGLCQRAAEYILITRADDSTHTKALKGAVKTTAAVFVTVYGTSLMFCGLESAYRALGGEPRWALFEGDCAMRQFENSPSCNGDPIVSAQTLLTAAAAIGSAAGGKGLI